MVSIGMPLSLIAPIYYNNMSIWLLQRCYQRPNELETTSFLFTDLFVCFQNLLGNCWYLNSLLYVYTFCYIYFAFWLMLVWSFLVIVAIDVQVLSCFPMNLHYGSRYSHSCLKLFPPTQLFSLLTNHYSQLSSNSYVTYLYICLKITTYHLPSKSQDIKLQQMSPI